ncbi:hypothetical protein FRX31_029409 [Thalictrum thalictroides]|uniref:Uncharacterized protein n=1 Tax=Thalictrum thalictroides TaxID=46969 RepID=A0A7J6V7A6_THATH|nr:hypothetical protein FRX31_029409 [Thalictrum thalictroides]
MASGLPDEMDEADIKDTEKHEEYEKNVYSPENKEKMERSIAAVGNILKDGSLIAATVAGGFAGNDIKNGNIPKAVRSGLIATGSVIVGEVGKLACENIKRSIKNIPDYHPVDEPVSPSVYEVTEVTIKKAMLPIFDILGYISALDDGYKLAIYSVLLIIIAIGLGDRSKRSDNYSDKGISKFVYCAGRVAITTIKELLLGTPMSPCVAALRGAEALSRSGK